jgi:nucleoside phosphorylase
MPHQGRDPFDVLIVTALLEELQALRAVSYGGAGAWEQAKDPDGFIYHHRQLLGDDGAPIRVAAAWTGAMGEAAAAARTTALIGHLSPACLAMCGICAGDPREVFLGDVIVADRVYSYDHGKIIAAAGSPGGGEARFFHDIETYSLDPTWKMDVTYFSQDIGWSAELVKSRPPSLASQERWLLRALLDQKAGGPSAIDHPERRARCPDWTALMKKLTAARLVDKSAGLLSLTPEGERRAREDKIDYPDDHPEDPAFRVHVGPLATGKTVRQDPTLFERLEVLVRKTVGVEMEAAAIGHVAQQLGRRAIVVKAVSDYADHDKDNSFRAFAARVSAEFLLRFLCHRAPRAARPGEPTTPVEPVAPVAPPRRSDAAKNPFQTAGSLEAGHPTYVLRPCDAELDAALGGSAGLIAIEGDYQIGKSSLLLRVHEKLARTQLACHVDLSGLNPSETAVFNRSLFRRLSKTIGKKVEDWPDIEDEALERPIALLFDEFGHIETTVAESFVPSLYHRASDPRNKIQIVVCLPRESIKDFLKSVGIDNPKYHQGWRRIQVGHLDDAGVDHLLSMLPERISEIARPRQREIGKLSGYRPRAVQCLCSRLFDAAARGLPDAALLELIGDKQCYE